MKLAVRSFVPDDAEALGEVFHRSVREGAAHRYTADQVEAWSPKPPSGEDWRTRLTEAQTFVADSKDGPLGFMTLDAKGYLDLAFVVPEAMGKGVADALYANLENRARTLGIAVLTTQASLLAEPFFARQGWQVTRRQEIEIGGVVLANAWMEKVLNEDAA